MRMIVILLCGMLAACSQTGSAPQVAVRQPEAAAKPAASTQDMTPEAQYAAMAARCEEAVRREQQKSMAAASLGGVLSMVGGFAGVGGEAAAIAGQAASVGGSLVSAGAQSNARTAIEKECMS
jgi:hypothetical protein